MNRLTAYIDRLRKFIDGCDDPTGSSLRFFTRLALDVLICFLLLGPPVAWYIIYG
jgi:hypothetical protein